MLQIRPQKRSSKFPNRRALAFEPWLLFSVLLTGFPATVLSVVFVWLRPYSLDHKMEATAFLVLFWSLLSISIRDAVVDRLRILANVIAALKEEDFSFRVTSGATNDAFSDLVFEVNTLARAMKEQRLGATEALSLLRSMMGEVGAAIFGLSPDGRVHLVNRAGAAFLEKNEEQVLNRTAEELGIRDLFEGPPSEIISRSSIHREERRWVVRRTHFRQYGVSHELIVLSEVSEALRSEERLAWKRLIRVLSHEINNSLAPIKSIARTLARISARPPMTSEVKENLQSGLEVIGSRAESLNRFIQNYAQLAKLPPPSPRTASLRDLIEHVLKIEPNPVVTVSSDPDIEIYADPDQIEQALINLVRNALDAVAMNPNTRGTPGAVAISWEITSRHLSLRIKDLGIGCPNTENLFVPFYTTKESGSGIGLILSRQIVEAHGGTLHLRNRPEGVGCEVELILPRRRDSKDWR